MQKRVVSVTLMLRTGAFIEPHPAVRIVLIVIFFIFVSSFDPDTVNISVQLAALTTTILNNKERAKTEISQQVSLTLRIYRRL